MDTSFVRFTNCVLAFDGTEKQQDLVISKTTGRIVDLDGVLDESQVQTIDLGGRMLAPGLIDVQLNGCCGINFSDCYGSDDDTATFAKKVHDARTGLIETGVTSFLPTLTTAKKEMFTEAIPFYVPDGHKRDPLAGSESLGIHCEGPFICLSKKGAHDPKCLQTPTDGVQTIEDFYGLHNLTAPVSEKGAPLSAVIRKITFAPELPGMLDTIRDLTQRHGTIVSMGHSEATYEQGLDGLRAGATMLTHTFNAMEPFLHRSPGLVGLLSVPETELKAASVKRPFFGLIADGIHLHPSVARAAWSMNKDGCIVTTDGTAATGSDLPDGVYIWKQGSRRLVKSGRKLCIEGTDTIAGGTTTLLQCVSNLARWAGISAAEALQTVTTNPARFLGIHDTKGTLVPGADADLLVLSWDRTGTQDELLVDEAWKFGTKVFERTTIS